MESFKLEMIFKMQEELMLMLEKNKSHGTLEEKTQMSKSAILAGVAEMVEVLNEMNWKPWKKVKKQVNEKKIKEELIDVLHFVIELMIIWRVSPEDAFKAFTKKHLINMERQKGGY